MNFISEFISVPQNAVLLTVALVFAVPVLICRLYGRIKELSFYVSQMWIFILILLSARLFSFYFSTWLCGLLSFFTLREYFTLVEMRTQDRLAMLAAYFAIPFMMHFVHTAWYPMFIITIPVYAFLVIPFFTSLGGRESDGAVFSIGVIDFGLFLFVYCMGHLAYLSQYCLWMAVALILAITICELIGMLISLGISSLPARVILKALLPMPFTIGLLILLSDWIMVPYHHGILLGGIIAILVVIGNHTVEYLEKDLRILPEKLRPGRGLILHNMKAVLYTAPIVLHYYRYFIL